MYVIQTLFTVCIYFRLQKAIPILSAKQKLMKMAVFIEFKKPAKTKDVDTPHINLF